MGVLYPFYEFFQKEPLAMAPPGYSMAIGLKKGFPVTKINKKTKNKRGKPSKHLKFIKDLCREVTGFSPDGRRKMELLKVSRGKRALKFLKKRLGTHQRAKRKREELSNVLVQMRKAASQKTT